jgi:predicted RNase H-like HicB family nuclease
MKTLTYTIHLEPAEEGGYTVTVPALPGCVTEGDTYDEAVEMARDCIRGFLEALAKADQPIPVEADDRRPRDVSIRVELTASA